MVVILFIFLYDEGVGKKSVTILVLALLLVGGVAGGVFWYLKHQRTVISDLAVEKSGNLPLELAVDFDPTVNSPKFMIESVDTVHSLKFLVKSRISKPPYVAVLSVNDLHLADRFLDLIQKLKNL